LSVMAREAVRLPLAEGVKVTLMVQLELAAREAPQLLVWAKSPALEPERAMLVRVKGALPELVRVTACVGLVAPTDWLPKLRLEGETPARALAPVPERLTD